MSFYVPTMSRPRAYDPDLARRAAVDTQGDGDLVSLAERIAETQNRALRRELGLSDDETATLTDEEEEKDDNYAGIGNGGNGNGAAVAQVRGLREELEQLQHRYLNALKDVHEMGERERKAFDQLSTLKRMSKSQVSILKGNYKQSFDKQFDLLEEILDCLAEREMEAGRADNSKVKSFRDVVKAHKAQVLAASTDNSKAVDPGGETDAIELKKQVESAMKENALLQRSLRDLSSGAVAFKMYTSKQQEGDGTRLETPVARTAPQTSNEAIAAAKNGASASTGKARDQSGSESTFSSKINSMDSDALKCKLVKALKVAKHSQNKLADKEKENEQLMTLLNEARLELEKRNASLKSNVSGFADSEVPPPVPLKTALVRSSALDRDETKEQGGKLSPITNITEPGQSSSKSTTTNNNNIEDQASAAVDKQQSKSELIKAKFEKLKRRLEKKEKECVEVTSIAEELSKQVEQMKKSISDPAATPAVASTPSTKGKEAEAATAAAAALALKAESEKVRALEALLDNEKAKVSQLDSALSAERKKAKATRTSSVGRHQRLLAQMRVVQTRLAEEKRQVQVTRRKLVEEMEDCQRDSFALVKGVQDRVLVEKKALEGVVDKYARECAERKRLFNLVQELRGNIRVLCRVRPPLGFEADDVAVTYPTEESVCITNPTNGREQSWEFDHVFQPGTTNEQVFSHVSDLCTSILDGYNVCIFAYGQTGSGKTHTMEGTQQDRGVNFRALGLLFDQMAERSAGGEWTFQIQVSLLEIYNEQIRDLLTDKRPKGSKLEVKASKHGMHVPGLTMITVANQDQVTKLMELGKRNRTTASTQMNSDSSRSHCMLSIYVVATNGITKETLRGKLHLIDLAGSERISKSGVKGAQLAEATNINKSLSSLGDVIQARAKKQGHVPYRNSTLTYLLQDSLSSNSKTFMFVALSPVSTNAGESTCSLNFASRARQVELGKASKNK